MKKIIISSAAAILLYLCSNAQNLAVNTDGSAANANAILDVKSNNKGVLIPRMSTAARLAIPATQGLLVYDINTNSFWYNTGVQWQNMGISTLAATGPWLVTGNSGTDATNFLGTTDNVPLNIRVNNFASGQIDHVKNNAFWGYGSGAANTTGQYNTGVGHEALRNNTTGYSNTAYGRFSLRMNTTGHSNTAVGMDALTANTIGTRNTAMGMLALLSNTIGKENTAMGFDALRSNTQGGGNTATGATAMQRNINGYDNTAYGGRALINNTSGSANTAIGFNAMPSNNGNRNTAIGYYCMWLATSGNNNAAMGPFALSSNQEGSFNTAIGDHALYGNQGSYNTGIGDNADVYPGDVTNATAIGASAIVDASNQVRIGNSAVTVIEGQVPFTTPSDGRFKFNVQEDVKGVDFLMQLRPVTYHIDVKRFDAKMTGANGVEKSLVMQAAYTEAEQMRRTGFIAQEVEQAAQTSGYHFSGIIKPKKEGDHYSLSYDAFVVPLVKAVQEQQQVIESQNKKIANLQQQLDEIKKLLQQKK